MKKWLFKLLGIVTEPPDGRPCLRQKNKWVEDEVASTTEVVESVKKILQANNP